MPMQFCFVAACCRLFECIRYECIFCVFMWTNEIMSTKIVWILSKIIEEKKTLFKHFLLHAHMKKNVNKYCWQQSNRVQHKHINIHLCSIMFEFTSIIYTWHWLNRSNAIVAVVVFVISCCYFFPVLLLLLFLFTYSFNRLFLRSIVVCIECSE